MRFSTPGDPQPDSQTLVLHWIVRAGTPGASASSWPVELNARLAGSYASVGDLKSAGSRDEAAAADLVATAEPVHPSGLPGERPSSTIAIPSTAPPGFYNLVTSVTTGAAVVTGMGIVRVVPGG